MILQGQWYYYNYLILINTLTNVSSGSYGLVGNSLYSLIATKKKDFGAIWVVLSHGSCQQIMAIDVLA